MGRPRRTGGVPGGDLLGRRLFKRMIGKLQRVIQNVKDPPNMGMQASKIMGRPRRSGGVPGGDPSGAGMRPCFPEQ